MNNTGTMKNLIGFVNGTTGDADLTLALIIKYKNGRESDMLYASRMGTRIISGILIPDGATVYLVTGAIKNVSEQYRLTFDVGDASDF
ncbi:hypothetical protein M3650_02320 [Paenibacillus sp. MER TA 81-3]|uniref:hypothetical protein n=1 Tax=Paenibacillus sp. MER TA 81-3 TaxID=2939573 RepID=UPI00203EFA48|nr:hypothetical protein [Paenibacillus sp. MER TA 81-3]MCM3337510.1 hypothetical protein [Paenibacillus sp. MER TA 81-3]